MQPTGLIEKGSVLDIEGAGEVKVGCSIGLFPIITTNTTRLRNMNC